MNSFVCVLEEIDDPQNHFKINWPLLWRYYIHPKGNWQNASLCNVLQNWSDKNHFQINPIWSVWSKNLSFNFPNLFFLSNFWSSKIAHNITWNNFYMTLVKLNRYIQHWQKKESLINYLQKIADKGNCIYNLGICIMHIVFIVVDNQVDLSINRSW